MAECDRYDVVELTDTSSNENLGYSADDRGLMVQRDGKWIATARSIFDAAQIIMGEAAEEVQVVASDELNGASRRWVAKPATM